MMNSISDRSMKMLMLAVFLVASFSFVASASAYTGARVNYNYNVSNAESMAFDCLNSDCSSVTSFSGSYPFGSTTTSGEITIDYPANLQNQGYAVYHVSPGYVPLEFHADWHCDSGSSCGPVEEDKGFYKIDQCSSTIDSFSVTNDVYENEPVTVGVDASLDSDVSSAFDEADTGVKHVPSAYKDQYYSAWTNVTLTVEDENGTQVYSDEKAKNIYMSAQESVNFTWTPGDSGNHTIKVQTDVTDAQCASSTPLSSSKETVVQEERPQEEYYTIINDLSIQDSSPIVNEEQKFSFTKISNFANINYTKHPVATHATYQIVDNSGSTVFSSAPTLPANSNAQDEESFSFNWTPSSSGKYNVTVSGVSNKSFGNYPTSPDSMSLSINVASTPTFAVEFKVTDSSGSAVDSATVDFSNSSMTRTATTDSSGVTTISNLATGGYDYQVSKSGYVTKNGSISITSSSPSTIQKSVTLSTSNTAPTISGLPDVSLAEGGSTSIDLDNYVSDDESLDSDLSWSYSGNSNVAVSIDSNRVATFSASNFTGSEDITFTVEDPQGATDSSTLTATVTANNSAPTVSGLPDQTLDEDTSNFDAFYLPDYVSDAETSYSNLAVSITSVSQTGCGVSIGSDDFVDVNPQNDFSGSCDITITAEDPEGATGSDTFTVTVKPVNDAPQITSSPVTSVNAYSQYYYQLSVNDPDNSSFIYSIDQGPSGLTVNNSGEVVWNYPTASDIGNHSITLRVSDGIDSDTQSYTLTVNNATSNQPPVADIQVNTTQGLAPLNVFFNSSGSYDPDGNITSYSWSFGEGGAATGAENNYEYTVPGVYTATLTVEDNSGSTSTASVDINVSGYKPSTLTTVATPLQRPWDDTNVTVNVSVVNATHPVEGIEYEWKYFGLNGSENFVSGTDTSLQVPRQGSYELCHRANNSRGYYSNWTCDGPYQVDYRDPFYSNATTKFNDPVEYTEEKHVFNITWEDRYTLNRSSIRFELDGKNYTDIEQLPRPANVPLRGVYPSYSYQRFSFNKTLAAGNHTYRWYISDLAGNTEATPVFSYTVQKADPKVDVLLNGTSADRTYNISQIANITALTNTSTSPISLESNISALNGSTGTGEITEIFSPGQAGTFYVNATAGGDQNHSFDSQRRIIEVVDTEAPDFTPLPQNQIITEGMIFDYDIDAVDNSGTVLWSINDTTRFSIDSQGIVRNNTALTAGNYTVGVNASDPSGNVNSSSFRVRVIEGNLLLDSYINNTYYDGLYPPIQGPKTLVNRSIMNHSNTTESTIEFSRLIRSVVNYSTAIQCEIIDSEFLNSYCSNSYIENSTVEGSNVTDSTVLDSDLQNSDIDNSFIDPSTVTNSSTSNSTVINSTVLESTLIDSYVFNSTFNYSTLDNCNVESSEVSYTDCLNSDIINSQVEDSNVTNSTVNESTVDSSEITDSNVTDSIVNESEISGSEVVDSNITDSNVTDSTVTNSTADNCQVDSSTLNNSDCTDSSINNSDVQNSDINNSNIEESNVTDSNVTDSNVTDSDVNNSEVDNSDINNSEVDDSQINNSNIDNSTVSDSNVTDSNVTDSELNNSEVDNSTIVDSDLNNSEVTNSNVTNSTSDNCNIQDSTVSDSDCQDSTINNSNVDNSTIIDSNITDSNITDSNITNSTIDNSTIINSTVGDGNITNGTIIDGCLNYSGDQYCADDNTTDDNLTDIYNNTQPVASFTASSTSVNPGDSIFFDGSSSSDPDGNITSYSWKFGDGNNDTGVNTTHSYSSTGTYTVSLEVKDNTGATDTETVSISVTSSGGGGGGNNGDTDSSGGSGGGGGGGFLPGFGDDINVTAKDVDIDVVIGEEEEEVVEVKSTGETEVSVSASGEVEKFISFEKDKYTVDGDSVIPFTVSLPEETDIGRYTGTITLEWEDRSTEVPVNLNAIARDDSPLVLDIVMEENFFEAQPLDYTLQIGRKDVTEHMEGGEVKLDTLVYKEDGEVVSRSSETVTLQEDFQTFTDSRQLDSLEPGEYTVKTTAEYKGTVTQDFHKFKVKQSGVTGNFFQSPALPITVAILVIIATIAIAIYS